MIRRLQLSFAALVIVYALRGQSPIPSDRDLFQNYDTAKWSQHAIQRVADIGRLWGVIKYFHPGIMKGRIDPDKLVIESVDNLLNDPSQSNFRATINHMLVLLADSTSKIITGKGSGIAQRLYSFNFASSAIRSEATVLSVAGERFGSPFNIDSCFNGVVLKNDHLLIDLRSASNNEQLNMEQYKQFVQPLVASLIDQTLILPVLRTAYHHALLRQDFPDDIDVIPASDRNYDPNYWYQERFGLKNVSQGAYVLPGKRRLRDKKICFIVNRNNNANTLKALFALRNRNKCYLIADGEMPDYLAGDYYNMELSDGVTVKIKVAERIYEDGSLGPKADMALSEKEASSADKLQFMAKKIFSSPPIQRVRKVENTVYIRLPQKNYDDNLYPERKLRLLGLFNFWNVIHYFSPNKHLIPFSWDSTLNYFVPRFLFAKDYRSYYWMLREISTRLHDGHAEVVFNNTVFPPAGINNYYLPFQAKYVEGKSIIVSLIETGMTSDQQGKMSIGDELLAIDNLPLAKLYENWRQYASNSNEPSYMNLLHKIPLLSRAGAAATSVTIRHEGKPVTLTLTPVPAEKYMPGFWGQYYPSLLPPHWKKLNDSTGYIRVNQLFGKQVDSAWQQLGSLKHIILDARGYPRNYLIAQQIVAPFLERIDTVCINAFPEITHPSAARNAVTLEVETISPSPSAAQVSKDKKFILLCAGNASQAETNIIAWQMVLKPVTIGTRTIGANGVSNTILMPGGYASKFSGFAVFYKDGTPNQERGVKIDIPVNITIKGVLIGNDEILERAVRHIHYGF